MGACWSKGIQAVTRSYSGFNSKIVSRDGNDLSSSSGKFSTASMPMTPRSECEILQACNLKNFGFSELKMATRNFRPDSVLGEGGFGSVFKGWIDEHSLSATRPGTGVVIAVKRLNQEGLQGHKEWLAEINYLGQLRHPNLVKLIGYCLEDDHRLLVYEFMPKGSMENHLFRRGSHFQPLSWSVRMKVALGAAKGLAFLHNAESQVIYRDFKTSNILLDSVCGLGSPFDHFLLDFRIQSDLFSVTAFVAMNPQHYDAKLSDFGLARDGPTGDKSHVSTRILGTFGYAAPEYLATGHLTAKSDIYSFGVVLLEMLSGRRSIDKNRPSGQHNLVEWAKPCLTSKRKIFRVLDPRIVGQYSLDEALKAGNLALQCLAVEPKNRPNMDDVVAELEELQDTPGSNQEDHPVNVHSQPSGDPGSCRSAEEASKFTIYPRPSASLVCA